MIAASEEIKSIGFDNQVSPVVVRQMILKPAGDPGNKQNRTGIPGRKGLECCKMVPVERVVPGMSGLHLDKAFVAIKKILHLFPVSAHRYVNPVA